MVFASSYVNAVCFQMTVKVNKKQFADLSLCVRVCMCVHVCMCVCYLGACFCLLPPSPLLLFLVTEELRSTGPSLLHPPFILCSLSPLPLLLWLPLLCPSLLCVFLSPLPLFILLPFFFTLSTLPPQHAGEASPGVLSLSLNCHSFHLSCAGRGEERRRQEE